MTIYDVKKYRDAEHAFGQQDLMQSLYDEGAVLMDHVLVTLHGDEHRARRTLEMRVFHHDFFRYYEQGALPQILDETIAPYKAAGTADIVDFAARVMINLTAAFAGIDRPEGSVEETETLVRLMRTFGLGATLLHSNLDREQVRTDVRNAIAEFEERFFNPSMARRQKLLDQLERSEIDEKSLSRDVLTVLLRNEDRVDLTRDLLVREIAFFYLAGAHTSIHTLGHVMHEVLTWCAAHPKDRSKAETDPVFLQRCVYESLRMHPASPIAMRKPAQPLTLVGGENVAGDDRVVIHLGEANRDAEIFGATAGDFNPYRETPKGVPPFGLSFGSGMHACLGRNLAAGALVQPGAKIDPNNHQYGTVTLIAQALLRNGAALDPNDPATLDTRTERITWGRYPVLLNN
jgi:cytochrome P450